jgi:FdhD protein
MEAKIDLTFTRYTAQDAQRVDGAVIGETRWTLYVNRREWVSFMATPSQLHYLALGFLVSEGVIAGLDDVEWLRVNEDVNRLYWYLPAVGLDATMPIRVCEEAVGVIDARLRVATPEPPGTRVLTSGCGGGVTFDDLRGEHRPLSTDFTVAPQQIMAMMQELNESASLYRACRGVHTSALSDGQRLLVVAEDVGRHNTLDKIRGECLLRGLATRDRILLTTGRISSEMITKAVKMEVPVVVSRTSPTALSVALAGEWNMTLIGYARSRQMNVYTGEERLRPARDRAAPRGNGRVVGEEEG